MTSSSHRGFSTIELIIILVLIGILSVVSLQGFVPATAMQLQSSRDSVVAAFYSAQQLAMSRSNAVQLTVGAQVDIRMDANGDGTFSANESVSVGGVRYPVSMPENVLLNASPTSAFDFNRLGYTSAATLTLSKADSSVIIEVDASGYVR